MVDKGCILLNVQKSGFYVVLAKELEQSVESDGCSKNASGDIGAILGAAIFGVDPLERISLGSWSRYEQRYYQPDTASTSTVGFRSAKCYCGLGCPMLTTIADQDSFLAHGDLQTN